MPQARPAPPTALVRGSLQVGRLLGIPICIHWSFLVALPFFAYLMAADYFSGGATSLTAQALAWAPRWP